MRRALTFTVVAGLVIGSGLAWEVSEAEAGTETGKLECGALSADLNGDGVVDFADFFILADQFGLSCDRTPAREKTALLTNGVTMDFIWIAPGIFTMGASPGEPGSWQDQYPQHGVTISKGFYLGKYEITQGQWEGVMGTRPWLGETDVVEKPTHPAVDISWIDLQELVHRLNRVAGDSLYRLPSEAEWEFSCRAGTTTRWSFGDDWSQFGDYGWFQENTWDVGEKYAHPVGTKLPNPWGLHDMHGNVDELVQDWYGTYSDTSQIDPTGPVTGTGRIRRGGSFLGNDGGVRSAERNYTRPDARYSSVGARLVKIK